MSSVIATIERAQLRRVPDFTPGDRVKVHFQVIEVAARGDVRRAKLYYLRERVGKRARVRERRYTGPEDAVQPGLLHEPDGATDADGMTAEETVAELAAEEQTGDGAV